MSLFEVSQLSAPGLSDISFALSAGELVCLSGPSGSGKTLLLRALADLDVSSGQVCLSGTEREQIVPTQWRRQVGFLPAESRWWAPRVGDHFADGQQAMLEQLGFEAEVREWQVERLSSGERQRLALVRLLANRPVVLLLDEPTANLDPLSTQKVEQLVLDYLRETSAACLWVTHDSAQRERIAGHSLRLVDGRLHEAAPA